MIVHTEELLHTGGAQYAPSMHGGDSSRDIAVGFNYGITRGKSECHFYIYKRERANVSIGVLRKTTRRTTHR